MIIKFIREILSPASNEPGDEDSHIPPEENPDSTIGFSSSFAFQTLFLIINTSLHVRMKYNTKVTLTQMTTQPY